MLSFLLWFLFIGGQSPFRSFIFVINRLSLLTAELRKHHRPFDLYCTYLWAAHWIDFFSSSCFISQPAIIYRNFSLPVTWHLLLLLLLLFSSSSSFSLLPPPPLLFLFSLFFTLSFLISTAKAQIESVRYRSYSKRRRSIITDHIWEPDSRCKRNNMNHTETAQFSASAFLTIES